MGTHFSLRTDADTLASLREKLSFLWGNLEERKLKSGNISPSKQGGEEDSKSPTFECCLKEYGIRTRRRQKKSLLKEGKDCREEEDDEDDDHDDDDHDDDGDGNDDERAEGGAGEGKIDERMGWERKWRMWGTTIS